jgi:hypothetical protein
LEEEKGWQNWKKDAGRGEADNPRQKDGRGNVWKRRKEEKDEVKEKVGHKVHKNVREEEVAARKRKAKVWVTGDSKKKRQEEGKVRGGIWRLKGS